MLACPRCSHQLRILRYRHAAAYRCAKCDGHAVTYPVVREALDAGRWRRLWRRVVEGRAGAGVRCPGCTQAMAEVKDGDLVIDSCRRCYLLWFDTGELKSLPQKPESDTPPPPPPPAPREEKGRTLGRAPESTWQQLCGWLGLPFEVDSPRAQRAYVTVGLVVTLVVVHLAAVLSGLGAVVREWGFVPDAMGRNGGLTWITSFFLHGGWLHLFSNAYFLAAFGDNVEEDLGHARYAVLLLVGTILGCALHAAADPRGDIPLVGASAGISAVLFYYAFRFPKARIGWALRWFIVPIWWFRMSARTAFGLWLVLQGVLALLQRQGMTNVSAMGHLGGVLAGGLVVVAQRAAAAGASLPPSQA